MPPQNFIKRIRRLCFKNDQILVVSWLVAKPPRDEITDSPFPVVPSPERNRWRVTRRLPWVPEGFFSFGVIHRIPSHVLTGCSSRKKNRTSGTQGTRRPSEQLSMFETFFKSCYSGGSLKPKQSLVFIADSLLQHFLMASITCLHLSSW